MRRVKFQSEPESPQDGGFFGGGLLSLFQQVVLKSLGVALGFSLGGRQ
jgi:hypothetical protein